MKDLPRESFFKKNDRPLRGNQTCLQLLTPETAEIEFSILNEIIFL